MDKNIFMLCESMQDKKEIEKLDKNRFMANLKEDGERVMCYKKENSVILFNRRGNIVSYKFNEVVSALKELKNDFLIDGEIIDFTNNFNLLSRRALTKDKNKIAQLEKEIPVKFMIFDILSFNNKNIMQEPLKERLNYLQEALKENKSKNLELVEYEDIIVCLKKAILNNGEGIVIKDMNGIYESKRSKNWYKYKLFKEATITITGFTENNAGIRATDNNGTAVQIAGTQSQEVKQILESIGYATINIQYLSQSKEGKYRFPSYRGLTNEK